MAIKLRELKIPYHLIFIFFLLSAGIGIAGHYYYENQREHIKKDKMYELSTLASIKVSRIQSWLGERHGDAKLVLENPYFTEHVREWMKNPSEKETNKIIKLMKAFQNSNQYDNVLLLDTKGNILLSAKNQNGRLGLEAKRLVKEAIRTKKEVFSDIHKSEEVKDIHLDILVPVLEDSNFPVGVLMLRINPNYYFYPLIQTWPTQSQTSEAILIRREGDNILFLNELRRQKNTALSFRLPMSNPFISSAMAAQEQEGIFEEIDYRGVPVLAAIKSIPDSPWFLITKIDREEIYAPVKLYAQATGLIVFLLIIATGTSLGFVWRHQRALFYREKYEAEHMRRRAENTMKELLDLQLSILSALPHATVGLENRVILFANESVETVFGWKPNELIGKNTRIFYRNDEEYEKIARLFYPVLEKQRIHSEEFICRHKDGRDILCKVSTSRIGESLKEKKIVVVYEDITAQKEAEKSLLASEERFRKLSQEFNALLDTIPDNITLLSPDMKIIWMNQSVIDRSGKDPASLIGQPCYKAWYDSNIPCERCPVEMSLKTQKTEIGYITTPDRRIFEARAFPITSENGEIINLMYMSRDITEHRKLEQQLLQSQKMEAVGVLTGGIAHEFNNILQAIMSIGSLMQMKIKEGDPLRQYVIDLLA
ncbi:MAG: hypothetical protein C0415_04565, partial [Thermodesulfovibrio sp.]|nr:hypothetical protein [Thermodesulfovibrio sp.]